MKHYYLILLVITLGACAHVKPPPEFLVLAAKTCTSDVKASEQARHSSRLNLQTGVKNGNDMALFIMAYALADANRPDPFATCNGALASHYNAEAQAVTSVNRTIGNGLGVTGLVLGTKFIADGLVELGNGGGSSTNITGSRVVSESSHSSASGDFLGIGNTNTSHESQAIGGFEPRGVNGAEIGTSPSQSGENGAVNPLPPTVQPVE